MEAIDLLKNVGIYSLSYVLQKPPFLSESLAIEDSVNTIKWAFEHGVDVVSLEPVSVQKNTLIHLLYSIKEFLGCLNKLENADVLSFATNTFIK